MAEQKFRVESDLLGELKVPADALYGVQTQRGINNYHISRKTMSMYHDFIIAIAYVKLAAVETNHTLGVINDEIAGAISQACRELIDGKWHHYALTFDTNEDNTLTTVNVFDDYKQVVGTSQTCAGIYQYSGGHKLQMGLGSSNPPFTLGYVNSLRFTRGVLTPDRFLGRVRKGTVLVLR